MTAVVACSALLGVSLVGPASPAHALGPTPAKPYDFNGDGHPELVIGSSGVTVRGHAQSGEFVVIPGTSVGHGTAGAKSWNLDSPGVPGWTHSSASLFGWSTASGDINGDGYADLLISAPQVPSGSFRRVGSVTLMFGSAKGLTTTGALELTPSWFGVAPLSNSYFGQGLVVGDFDGDGYDDVALSAGGVPAQYVVTVRGGPHGLLKASRRVLTQDTPGVPGKRRAPGYGGFGYWMTVGDFNADGLDDLVVSDPYDAEDTRYSSGAVTVFKGAHNVYGLTTTGVQRWSLSTPAIPGSPTRFTRGDDPDSVGAAMAAGRRDGDGYDDLVIGVPGHDHGDEPDVGAVLTLYGGPHGLTTARAEFETALVIAGRIRAHEQFGSTVGIANLLGESRPQFWVAAQLSNTVFQLHLATNGSHTKTFTENTVGIPDTNEKGDNFGACLRAIDPDGDGVDSLVVTAIGEDQFAGAVTIVSATPQGDGWALSGQLLKPGKNGLTGVHVPDGLSGSC